MLAHEVSHVANGDMVTLALIQGVVNTFVIVLSRVVGHAVDRVVFKTEREHGPAFWITTIVAQVVLGILASMIVMWFSRRREFRADAGGAAPGGARQHDRRARASEAGPARAAARPDGRLRHLGRRRPWPDAAVHVAPAARRAHRGAAQRGARRASGLSVDVWTRTPFARQRARGHDKEVEPRWAVGRGQQEHGFVGHPQSV